MPFRSYVRIAPAHLGHVSVPVEAPSDIGRLLSIHRIGTTAGHPSFADPGERVSGRPVGFPVFDPPLTASRTTPITIDASAMLNVGQGQRRSDPAPSRPWPGP